MPRAADRAELPAKADELRKPAGGGAAAGRGTEGGALPDSRALLRRLLAQTGNFGHGAADRTASARDERFAVRAVGAVTPISPRLQRQPRGDAKTRSPGQDVATGAGTVAEYEALLRTLYQRADEAIFAEAQFMLQSGVEPKSVAKWAVKARNQAKAAIRAWDLAVVRLLAEKRNLKKYGDPLGPSYEQLKAGDPAKSIRPHSDADIVRSAGKANAGVSRWAGRLRIAGRILIVVDIAIAAWQVASAPEVDRPRELLRQVGGLAGAAAGGWAGAVVGGEIGAAIGVWFGGAGAIPGAAIGGIIGGIGGALMGGFAGYGAGDLLADQFYPPAQTGFEGGFK
ncbi:MAG TPA: hypothetical protein VGO40_21595 [Longimicrobium sp.]|jgi:hypothetical protein|nr:hypothetical protein [Longimicrobium sp.]